MKTSPKKRGWGGKENITVSKTDIVKSVKGGD